MSRLVLSAAIAAAASLVFCVDLSAQPVAATRVATYNLLNFPGSTGAARLASLRRIMSAMRPHVLVAQEIGSAGAIDMILRDALNADGPRYAAAPYVDAGPDSENGFFFDSTVVEYLGAEFVATTIRAIAGYRFTIRGTRDTAWIYSAHLKAGEGTFNATERFAEAEQLRKHLDTADRGPFVLVAGDFNTYSPSEPAYVLLTKQDHPGVTMTDPLATSIEWHSNPAVAWMHTQSPRVRSFGGGSNGGLDDRFDMILVSSQLIPLMVRSSYVAYGNDGNHFNDSLNRPPNDIVPDSVAQALHDASDHLPVMADFRFGDAAALRDLTEASHHGRSSEFASRPNPSSGSVTFATEGRAGEIVIRDALGRIVARVPSHSDAQVLWDASSMPAGIYQAQLSGARCTVVIVH